MPVFQEKRKWSQVGNLKYKKNKREKSVVKQTSSPMWTLIITSKLSVKNKVVSKLKEKDDQSNVSVFLYYSGRGEGY